MLGSPILYLKGMRILMFQLSGFIKPRTEAEEAAYPKPCTRFGAASATQTYQGAFVIGLGFRSIL